MSDDFIERSASTKDRALRDAIIVNDPLLVKQALDAIGEIHHMWRDNRKYALHLAAKHGADEAIKILLDEYEFDPWRRDGMWRLPIDHALAKNYLEIYEMLDSAMYPKGWCKSGPP